MVGPYLSYQLWEDLRAMITKILLLLGAPTLMHKRGCKPVLVTDPLARVN
jgi:hypothetical protein